MRIVTLWLAAALCTALAGGTAKAQTQPTGAAEMARISNAVYARHKRQAERCRWGTATMDVAVFGEQYMWGELAAIEDPAFKQIKTVWPDEVPCESPENQSANSESVVIYWRWLTRSAIIAQLTTQPGWGQNLIDVDRRVLGLLEPVRAEIEKMMTASLGAARVQSEIAALRDESVLVLNLVCEPRKNLNSSTTRTCPELPANLVAQRPMALVRAQRVEAFSRDISDALPAEERGEYGVPYQFHYMSDDFGNMDFTAATSHDCDKQLHTIYPAARDTRVEGDVLDVSVHRIGVTGVTGRIKVKLDDYGRYMIVDGSGIGVFSDAMDPRFKQCF